MAPDDGVEGGEIAALGVLEETLVEAGVVVELAGR